VLVSVRLYPREQSQAGQCQKMSSMVAAGALIPLDGPETGRHSPNRFIVVFKKVVNGESKSSFWTFSCTVLYTELGDMKDISNEGPSFRFSNDTPHV
jgi:hypothetical protein